MASKNSNIFIVAILIPLIFTQATATPLFVRFLLQPFILDLEIRAGSVLNEAGIGVGGRLTLLSKFISKIFSTIAKLIENKINRITDLFMVGPERPDGEQIKRLLDNYRKNGDKHEKFYLADGI